jgi:hypothetical protein
MADLNYRLTFKGAASPTLRSAFADCELETADGVTMVRCAPEALSHVITQIQDLGLELLDVHLVADPDQVDPV